MIDIVPGLELDLAVATACKYHDIKIEGEFLSVSDDACFGSSGQHLFSPSTDMNAACAAAERVFTGWAIASDERFDEFGEGRFHALAHVNNDERMLGRRQVTAVATTPRLAICAAILKLDEEQ